MEFIISFTSHSQLVDSSCPNLLTVLALTDKHPVIPDHVIQEMVKTISKHNIATLSGNWLLSYFKDFRRMKKKKKQIQYDREVSVCAGWLDRWNSPFLRKHLECTLRVNHGMVDNTINHIAKKINFGDSLCVEHGSPPYVPMWSFVMRKWCCAMEFFQCLPGILSNGWDYLQVIFIMINKKYSMLQCTFNIHLRKPTKLNAWNIFTLHQGVNNISGVMGFLDKTKVHWKICPTAWKGRF